MQVKRTNKSDNEVVLLITGDAVDLDPLREHILKDHFAKDIKVQGFRQGKAPLHLVEKNVDQSLFQQKFLDEALNNLYREALNKEDLRATDQPEVSVKKFVPFTLVEFEATVPILGKVILPDYKKIKLPKDKPKAVPTTDVDEVINRLATQLAEKVDVNRAAKDGDQVFIDYKGVDSKGKAVNGADGKNYPITLGSNSFIPGFETNLIGLKAGDDKTFTLKFPKDYTVKALASRDVTFSVSLIKVQEIKLPEINDEFAKKVGPFKSVTELKTDIKKQLTQEKQNEVDREYESKLMKEISSKSKVSIPANLIDNEIENRLKELKLNLSYRGQTFQEYLDIEGKTEEEYTEQVMRPEAEERLKASIVLSEISEIEKVPLTNEEVEQRLALLKAQYQDPQSQADLENPEAKRDVASRMLAEKTIAKLTTYANRA
jgi:trigger factor